jgi:hypothetical protein
LVLPETDMAARATNERGRSLLALLVPALVGVALLAAAIGLWARHGAAVFFDMVAAGIAYCF